METGTSMQRFCPPTAHSIVVHFETLAALCHLTVRNRVGHEITRYEVYTWEEMGEREKNRIQQNVNKMKLI